MSQRISGFLLLILLSASAVISFSGQAVVSDTTIKIESGMISGAMIDGVSIYKGIPYAAFNLDGWAFPDEVRNIFAKGKQNAVPVIVGSNANEMTTLTTPAMIPKTLTEYRNALTPLYGEALGEFDAFYPAKTDADVPKAYLDSLRDVRMTLPMRTWARMTATGKSKAYLYWFSHVPPNPNSKYLGAYHAGEIAYVFHNLNPQNTLIQNADHQLAELMMGYWVNFATTGNPNGQGLPEWKAYEPKTEPYLEFATPVRLRNHLLKGQLDFLEQMQKRR